MHENKTSLQFELFIQRINSETGEGLPIERKLVLEDIDNEQQFYDELVRIGKKQLKDSFICFVFLDEKILYKDIISDELMSSINNNLFYDPEPLKVQAGMLIKQFDLDKKIIPLGINWPDRGQLMGSFKGIEFYFHTSESNRHHEKHVHCWNQGDEIVIKLEPVEILEGSFRNRKNQRKALRIVEKYQADFINYWNHIENNGEALKTKFRFTL